MEPVLIYGWITALLVGLAKTGVPGVGILAVPVMAWIDVDAKQSVGTLLPMLIVADLFAVAYYRHHAQWDRIRGLFPWVGAGLLVGFSVLRAVDRARFAPFLGGLVFCLVVLELVRKRWRMEKMPHHPLFVGGIGMLTGFATMVGNAAGPVMNIYLLCHGLQKKQFMGSTAWMFLTINCIKVPFFASQGMITVDSLRTNALMVPAIVAGALLGRWLLPRIPQKVFNQAVLILSILAAVGLCFQGPHPQAPATNGTPENHATPSHPLKAPPPALPAGERNGLLPDPSGLRVDGE